jgi:hypothetical protein
MFCGKCGRKLDSNTKNCPLCGSSVASNNNIPPNIPKKQSANKSKSVNLSNVFYILLCAGLILFCYNFFDNLNSTNQFKNTVWRSSEPQVFDTYFILKFGDEGYELSVDWAASTWEEKPNNEIRLKERGQYEVEDDDWAILKPAIFQHWTVEGAVSSLGANMLLLENETLTVIDGDKFLEFRKF